MLLLPIISPILLNVDHLDPLFKKVPKWPYQLSASMMMSPTLLSFDNYKFREAIKNI
jgi:hypothetical protein